MNLDFQKILFQSFDWAKDAKSVKYFFLVAFVHFLSFVLFFGLMFILSPQALNCFLLDSCDASASFFADIFFNPSKLFLLTGIFLTSLLFDIFVINYVTALTELYGLESMGFKNPGFDWGKLLRYVVLLIAAGLAALFWSFNRKARIVQWACVAVLLVLGAMVFATSYPLFLGTPYPPSNFSVVVLLIAVLVGVLVALPYSLIVFYNSMKLIVSSQAFLNSNMGIIDSLKRSWELTAGRVLDVFVAGLVVGIVYLVVFGIISAILLFLFALPLMTFVPSFDFAISFSEKILTIIIAPFALLVNGFFLASLYSALGAKAKTRTYKKKMPEHSQPWLKGKK